MRTFPGQRSTKRACRNGADTHAPSSARSAQPDWYQQAKGRPRGRPFAFDSILLRSISRKRHGLVLDSTRLDGFRWPAPTRQVHLQETVSLVLLRLLAGEISWLILPWRGRAGSPASVRWLPGTKAHR